jgi:hypothetical protein
VEIQDEVEKDPDFFQRHIPGKSIPMTVLRVLARVVGWIAMIMAGTAAIIWPIVGISLLVDKFQQRKRRLAVARLDANGDDSALRSAVFAAYVNSGEYALRRLLESAADAQEYYGEFLPHVEGFADEATKDEFVRRYQPRRFKSRLSHDVFGVADWLKSQADAEKLEAETLQVARVVGVNADTLQQKVRHARRVEELFDMDSYKRDAVGQV